MKPTTRSSSSTSRTRSQQEVNNNNELLLGPYDILCGKCKGSFNNVGNRRFRITIGLYLDQYLKATSKKQKIDLILSIVGHLRNCVGARFLKMAKKAGSSSNISSSPTTSSSRYMELGEREAREKVGRALRDLAVSTIHQSTMSEFYKYKEAQKKHKQQTKSRSSTSEDEGKDDKSVKKEDPDGGGVQGI
jgi:hypothetical protein